MATRETVEDELARKWAALIARDLERMPVRERRERLRIFKRSVELVEREWALVSF
jgi:hypothetical protein